MEETNEVVEVNPPAELDAVLTGLGEQFRAPNLKLDGPPHQLGGGFWAESWALTFVPLPERALPSQVVLRLAPVSHLAAWENTIQTGVGKQGYPTPRIYSSDSARDGLRAWCVMDFAAGHPLLAGLNGVRTFATLPRLSHTLSITLARAAADLHRLDPAPIESELARLNDQPVGADGLIDHYITRILELPDRSLRLALEALAANRPVSQTRVVCHGDLHPFNVLVSGTQYTVLDWTSARIADPAFDLAFTHLLLANPPLSAPKALRPIINLAGRCMANRFLAAYHEYSTNQINSDTLDWYRSLQAFRILFDLAYWRDTDTLGVRREHPWWVIEPALRKIVQWRTARRPLPER
jgi:aminoglycoside phosphotransferase (APT) family kinase protein